MTAWGAAWGEAWGLAWNLSPVTPPPPAPPPAPPPSAPPPAAMDTFGGSGGYFPPPRLQAVGPSAQAVEEDEEIACLLVAVLKSGLLKPH